MSPISTVAKPAYRMNYLLGENERANPGKIVADKNNWM